MFRCINIHTMHEKLTQVCSWAWQFSSQKINQFILITSIFLVSASLIFHEPWRDEVSPWLLTYDADWLQVFYRSRLEIQSPIFLSFLKILHFISEAYLTYRVVTVFVSITTIFMVYWLCKKRTFLLIGFLSNYYLIYEYGWIQRIYTYEIFLLVTYLYFFKLEDPRGRRSKSLTILIIFSLVSIWSLFISFIICCLLIYRNHLQLKSKFVCAYSFVSFAHLIFIFYPSDRNWGVNSNSISSVLSLENFIAIANSLFRAVLVIPNNDFYFWNSSIFDQKIFGYTAALAIPFIAVSVAIYLLKNRSYFFIFILITIVPFVSVLSLGKQRHLGQIFILIIACTFLSLATSRFSVFQPNYTYLIFILALIFSSQAYSTAIAVSRDLRSPFSSSAQLASFIEDGDLLIVQDRGVNSVLPLIAEKQIKFYNFFGETYSYGVELNSKTRISGTDGFYRVCISGNIKRIVLFTDEITKNFVVSEDLKLIHTTSNAIQESEGYRRLYLVAANRKQIARVCDNNVSINLLESLNRFKPKAYGE